MKEAIDLCSEFIIKSEIYEMTSQAGQVVLKKPSKTCISMSMELEKTSIYGESLMVAWCPYLLGA